MRISDWSSDVCSSDRPGDLDAQDIVAVAGHQIPFLDFGMAAQRGLEADEIFLGLPLQFDLDDRDRPLVGCGARHDRGITANHARLFEKAPASQAGRRRKADLGGERSEEHTSELQSLMRISYAVFCLQQKKNKLLHSLTIE